MSEEAVPLADASRVGSRERASPRQPLQRPRDLRRVPLTTNGRRYDAASVEGRRKAVHARYAGRPAEWPSSPQRALARCVGTLARPVLPGSVGGCASGSAFGGRREKAGGVKRLTANSRQLASEAAAPIAHGQAGALAGCRCTAR
jgi:hypothetical protein